MVSLSPNLMGGGPNGHVVDLDYGEVGIGILADYFGFRLRTVAEHDDDALGGLNDVPVGDHVPLVIPDESGAAGPGKEVVGHSLRDISTDGQGLDDAQTDH